VVVVEGVGQVDTPLGVDELVNDADTLTDCVALTDTTIPDGNALVECDGDTILAVGDPTTVEDDGRDL
jgi:hypothetical protein